MCYVIYNIVYFIVLEMILRGYGNRYYDLVNLGNVFWDIWIYFFFRGNIFSYNYY